LRNKGLAPCLLCDGGWGGGAFWVWAGWFLGMAEWYGWFEGLNEMCSLMVPCWFLSAEWKVRLGVNLSWWLLCMAEKRGGSFCQC
jgi:hypothetical protein